MHEACPKSMNGVDLSMDSQQTNDQHSTMHHTPVPATTSQCIDWYAEGQERTVDVGGIQVSVRYVGRNGRRGRIAITAPPGSTFRDSARGGTIASPDRSLQAADPE
jgi:hypothetical protein